MPYLFVADLGDMSFTLGLSGWTANDWSRAGNFDLLAPRRAVDDVSKRRVFDALKAEWRATPDALAATTGLDRPTVLGALSAYAQAGRAMYDVAKGVWRARELSREPLPLDALRFDNERERDASALVEANAVRVTDEREDADGNAHIKGRVEEKGKRYEPDLTIDKDERLVRAVCTCNFFQQNKLFKGPCAHMLALRTMRGRQREGAFWEVFTRLA
jgi:hypothetical protein